MKDFLKQYLKALFNLAIIAALLCLPLYGVALLLFLGMSQTVDPLRCLLVAFSVTYFLALLGTSAIAIYQAVRFYGDRIGQEIYVWLL